jgi:hypothetical protein
LDINKGEKMLCKLCKKAELIEGTLEGVSFKPLSEQRKFLSTGVYGIKVMVCPECGHLSEFKLSDVEVLRKIIKKNK